MSEVISMSICNASVNQKYVNIFSNKERDIFIQCLGRHEGDFNYNEEAFKELKEKIRISTLSVEWFRYESYTTGQREVPLRFYEKGEVKNVIYPMASGKVYDNYNFVDIHHSFYLNRDFDMGLTLYPSSLIMISFNLKK